MEDEAREPPVNLDHFIIIRSNAQKTPLRHAQKTRLSHGQNFPLPSWFPITPPTKMEDGAANKRMRVEADLDFFDLLPDDMMRIIISLMPTKSGVRTTILSKRWRHLWRSVPLDLTVDDRICRLDHERLTTVSQILAAHGGPITRLSIRSFRDNCHVVSGKIEEWFKSPALNHLKELFFEGGPPIFDLPASVLRLLPTLHHARFAQCPIPPIEVEHMLLLPLLNHLVLYGVGSSINSIERLLGGCTKLESLQIDGLHGLDKYLHIVSATLRTISLSYWSDTRANFQLRELIIKEAPLLERLSVYSPNGRTSTTVINAPNLTLLGCYSSQYNSKLVFESITFQKMIPNSLTSTMRTVKVLALCIGPNLDAAIGFLSCFPCTEKLYIKTWRGRTPKKKLQYDTKNPIESLDRHLTEITLNDYRGTPSEVGFAKFFVLNASKLKLMRISIDEDQGDQWLIRQRRKLHLRHKASEEAEFHFKDIGTNLMSYVHLIHDLLVTDPFEEALNWRTWDD